MGNSGNGGGNQVFFEIDAVLVVIFEPELQQVRDSTLTAAEYGADEALVDADMTTRGRGEEIVDRNRRQGGGVGKSCSRFSHQSNGTIRAGAEAPPW